MPTDKVLQFNTAFDSLRESPRWSEFLTATQLDLFDQRHDGNFLQDLDTTILLRNAQAPVNASGLFVEAFAALQSEPVWTTFLTNSGSTLSGVTTGTEAGAFLVAFSFEGV